MIQMSPMLKRRPPDMRKQNVRKVMTDLYVEGKGVGTNPTPTNRRVTPSWGP
jgi:hypothetical protein